MALEDYLVPQTKKGPHLCNVCQYSIAACPWMHEGKPVPGWTVYRTYIKGSNKGNGYSSFCVTACPLYIAPSEERMAEQERQDREEAEDRRKEQDRRRGRLFF